MTLGELELELVKRGVVMSSLNRIDNKWRVVVASQDLFGLGVDTDLDAAVHKAIAEYDGNRAASFCVGEA